MPFVIPTVLVYDEQSSSRIVGFKARPEEAQLAAYIEYLEREIATAKVAWSQMTNTNWDTQPN